MSQKFVSKQYPFGLNLFVMPQEQRRELFEGGDIARGEELGGTFGRTFCS